MRLLRTHTEEQLGFDVELAIPWTKKNGKRGSYFPDIVIPGERRLIEVKSPYTFERGLADATLPSKIAACVESDWSATVEVRGPDGDEPLFELNARELLDSTFCPSS